MFSIKAPHLTNSFELAEHMMNTDPDINHFFTTEFQFQDDALSFQDEALHHVNMLDVFTKEHSFDEETEHPFVQTFNKWYETKTTEEKKWLNTHCDAQTMVTIALNGIDNHMTVSGVSM